MILILEFVNYSIISPVDPVVDPSLNRVSSYVIPPTGHSADKCELVFEVLHINTPAHSKHKHQNPKRHSSCENWKLVREGCQKNSCEKSGLLPNLPRPPGVIFLRIKKTPNFLFWEWTIDERNKFYTWSHQKIFLFASVILVYICPK